MTTDQSAATPASSYNVKAGHVGSLVPEQGSSGQQEAPSSAPSAPGPNLGNLDCLKAEAAKIERFLGISRDAGMTDAIRWANSDDPWTRVFASDVLLDMATPDALLYLRTLSNDANRLVATEAKGNLDAVGQPTEHTVDRASLDGLPSN